MKQIDITWPHIYLYGRCDCYAWGVLQLKNNEIENTRFSPFSSQAQMLRISGITIESSEDKVEFYGYLGIDRSGNEVPTAQQFITILKETLAVLETGGDPSSLTA